MHAIYIYLFSFRLYLTVFARNIRLSLSFSRLWPMFTRDLLYFCPFFSAHIYCCCSFSQCYIIMMRYTWLIKMKNNESVWPRSLCCSFHSLFIGYIWYFGAKIKTPNLTVFGYLVCTNERKIVWRGENGTKQQINKINAVQQLQISVFFLL